MRHFPVLLAAGPHDPRIRRLFELQRQSDVQSLLKDAGEEAEILRPDIAMRLKAQAIRSLRPGHS